MSTIKSLSIRYLICPVIALSVILLIAVPICIPYSITTHSESLSDRERIVVRLTNGSISSQLINHHLNVTEELTIIQVQRDDVMHFRMNPHAVQSDQVNPDDRLAAILSPDMEQNMVQLQGQLAQACSL
jgi:hypothetical protein